MVQRLKSQAIYLFLESGPYDSHTSLGQRAAFMVGCCENEGTLMQVHLPDPAGATREIV